MRSCHVCFRFCYSDFYALDSDVIWFNSTSEILTVRRKGRTEKGMPAVGGEHEILPQRWVFVEKDENYITNM